MPAPRSEQYWAEWTYNFSQVAKVSKQPHRDYGNAIGMPPKTVSALVHRMRQRGYLPPIAEGNEVTQKTLDILAKMKLRKQQVVVFDVSVRVETKAEALAEMWDVIQQLEHWDDRDEEPFIYRPARMKKLGENDQEAMAPE